MQKGDKVRRKEHVKQRGLNAPLTGAPISLGILLILSCPLGLVALPRLRHRWPFTN